MSDSISRQAANEWCTDCKEYDQERHCCPRWNRVIRNTVEEIKAEHLSSAQPEISRIEQELHGKTPEEQYEFLYWLLLKFGLTYTDSRLAVIEWLRGGTGCD